MLKKILTMVAMVSITQLASAGENLFEKHYKEQNSGGLRSMQANPETKMYVSNHQDVDNISMLEDGYDMMGSTGFESTNVPAALALAHAKSIKADTVLVYTKHAAQKTSFSQIETIKEAAKTTGEIDESVLKGDEERYRYYASYWAKIPTPLLGLHVIKLRQKNQGADTFVDTEGLKVLAVIKGSPAAKAQLLRGDMMLKLGDIVLDQPEQLSMAARKYAGKTVDITYARNGEPAQTKATLNSR